MVSVCPLDLTYLRDILKNDQEKLLKFWRTLAHRLIVFNLDELAILNSLSHDNIKLLVEICEIKIHKPGEQVDVKHGGILFQGGLSETIPSNVALSFS